MTKPIPDKAEVAIEYPDKLYIGTFERSARFEAHFDEAGVSLTLQHSGDADVRKSVRIHCHYALFSNILHDLANTVASMPPDDIAHRDALLTAAETLYRALSARTEARRSSAPATSSGDPKARDDTSDLTPKEEVLLLHVLE